MAGAPSLVSLCLTAVKDEFLMKGDDADVPPFVYDIPSELFDALVSILPPLALQKLQSHMPFECDDDCEYGYAKLSSGRKRGRHSKFNIAWRTLFHTRWPQLANKTKPIDWQQQYWETHLQQCLDEAAEVALMTSFCGKVGEIEIPDSILKYIGYEGCMRSSIRYYSRLSYNCEQFGYYARCLNLQSVLCDAEIWHLFRNSKLETLVLRWIRSQDQIDGLCKLLNQNTESLTSLDFAYCKFSPTFINAISAALQKKCEQTHGIQHFSITASKFDEINRVSLPIGLISFLTSGRSLVSFKLSENHLGKNFAKSILCTLLDASSDLSILDLSENNISGWLSDFNRWSSREIPSFSGVSKPLQSLRVLNLRGNNLQNHDVDNLIYALAHTPNLEVLDLSENPIEDDGVRSLIPYLVETSNRCSPFSDLSLENCELSWSGVTQLLNMLSTVKRPLRSLSIADNSLRSEVAPALGKFLSTSIQVLNIGGIGLGPSGFQQLQEKIAGESDIANINISKNHGGIESARFLSKLMSVAPKLESVNASYNLMFSESLTVIYSALKAAKGKLKLVDLIGNNWDIRRADSVFAEFQCTGMKMLILLSSSLSSDAPYDHDP